MLKAPLLILVATLAVAVEVDPALPDYVPVPGLVGPLNSIGSDMLNNLMTLWAERFQESQPGTTIQIEGKGGSTAPVALIAGYSQLGTMSRSMNEKEIAAFVGRWGYPPTAIEVAIDALAVFVHRDNPVPSLSFTEIDRIYSSTRKRGGAVAATWGDLGLTGEWSALPLVPLGRSSVSGNYGFFKQAVLQRGDFLPTVGEEPGSRAVVTAVAERRGGIGYCGIGYVTDAVRALPLVDGDKPPVAPTYAACLDGSYPLTRRLFIYINHKPGAPDPLTCQFLRFVLSKAGQQVVVMDGYFPLDSGRAAEQRRKLDRKLE